MLCKNCLTENPDIAKFCGVCGSKFDVNSLKNNTSQNIKCPLCSKVHPNSARYCGNTGQVIPMNIKQNYVTPNIQMSSQNFRANEIPVQSIEKKIVTDIRVTKPYESLLTQRVDVANPEQPHCATILLLDTSGSMADADKIGKLNNGIRLFKEEVMKDELAGKRVDVALVTFGGEARIVQPFTSIGDFNPPVLEADGPTAMGEAILKAVQMLEERKNIYKNRGVDYFRPWIFMITDGEPTDMIEGDHLWNSVVRTIYDAESEHKLIFFTVGIEPANMASLAKIMPSNRIPLKLRPGNFREMFQWLTNSQVKVAHSDLNLGDMVKLEPPTGWADIPTKP